MRRFIFIYLIILITTLLLSGCLESNSKSIPSADKDTIPIFDTKLELKQISSSEFATFKNIEKFDFIIKYPINWDIYHAKVYVGGVIIDEDLYFRLENYGSPLIISINPNEENLEQLTQDYISTKKQEKDFIMLESNEIRLAGNPAYQILYTYTVNNTEFKVMRLTTLNNNKAYTLTFYSISSRYNDDLDVFQKIVDSFDFI